jgi:lipopolysaccharide export system permease protein
MASDRETLAIRAAGISVWQVLPAVLALSGVIAVATLALSMTARPWGHREIERTAFEIAKTRASAAIRPHFFNTEFARMVVYVDRIDDATGTLHGVLLSDERGADDRSTVLARNGRIGAHDDSGRLYLQLFDGTSVSARGATAQYDVTSFRSLELSLELRTATGATGRSDEPATLAWNEITSALTGAEEAHAREAVIELHRRLSMAAAPIPLALLGVALGFSVASASRARAIAISILSVLAFQGLLTLSVALARSGKLPPAVALWMPDLLLALVAYGALARAARDRFAFPALFAAARHPPATIALDGGRRRA